MASKNEGYLKVYLGAPLKGWWLAYCNERSLKPGSVIKKDIQKLKDKADTRGAEKAPFKQKKDSPDTQTKVRKEIRFTPSELDAIETQCEGGSMQRWVINSVRASLTHEPQFTMNAVLALWNSSKELNAIGRNLNQIAKQLNKIDSGSITYSEIVKLGAIISEHAEQSSLVVAASLDRWLLKDD